MSAERLREAAALMRSRAEAASSTPWTVDRFYWKVDSARGLPNEWWVSVEEEMGVVAAMPEEAAISQANAEHIASWHPAVALAVADLLDNLADRHDTLTAVMNDGRESGLSPLAIDNATNWQQALAVADAYLLVDAQADAR